METFESIINITQSIVIILATIFTSWWAYKTFAHKEKISELKKILSIIEQIHFEIGIYKKLDDFRDVSQHERFIDLSTELTRAALSSLYIDKKNRNKIFHICSELINEYKYLSLRKYGNEWDDKFERFEKEYIEAKKLLYKVSEKYLYTLYCQFSRLHNAFRLVEPKC